RGLLVAVGRPRLGAVVLRPEGAVAVDIRRVQLAGLVLAPSGGEERSEIDVTEVVAGDLAVLAVEVLRLCDDGVGGARVARRERWLRGESGNQPRGALDERRQERLRASVPVDGELHHVRVLGGRAVALGPVGEPAVELAPREDGRLALLRGDGGQ